jgi:hypothetical protein
MRTLVTELFDKSPLLVLPLVALVIFMLVFAVADARVWRRPASAYAPVARLPLDDGSSSSVEEIDHA